jgi:hypothetical protein
MVDELSPLMEEIYAKAAEGKPWHIIGTKRSTPFYERYMINQSRANVEESDIIKDGDNSRL